MSDAGPACNPSRHGVSHARREMNSPCLTSPYARAVVYAGAPEYGGVAMLSPAMLSPAMLNPAMLSPVMLSPAMLSPAARFAAFAVLAIASDRVPKVGTSLSPAAR